MDSRNLKNLALGHVCSLWLLHFFLLLRYTSSFAPAGFENILFFTD